MKIILNDAEQAAYSDPLELCMNVLGNVPGLLTELVKDLYPGQELKRTGMTTPTGAFYKLTKDGETNLVHISNRSVQHIIGRLILDSEREALGLTINKAEVGEINNFIAHFHKQEVK